MSGLGSTLVDYAPETYSDRGAAIPYTTPVLAQARVRVTQREKLELLVPATDGIKGTYVVRWADVPGIFRGMTLHDRMLHKEVGEERATEPEAIRSAALRVASMGVAGPQAAAAANSFLLSDENDALITNVFLMHRVITSSGVAGGMSIGDLTGSAGQLRAKQALERVATGIKADATTIYRVIQQWSHAIRLIGLPDMPHKPRHRKLITNLDKFRAELAEWADHDVTEAAPVAAAIAEMLDFTLKLAAKSVGQIDHIAGRTLDSLRVWSDVHPVLSDQGKRIGWILNGWDFVLQLWQDVSPDDIAGQRHTILDMPRFVPLLPKEEMSSGKVPTIPGDPTGKRRVKAAHDWGSNVPVPELVARLERIKARAA